MYITQHTKNFQEYRLDMYRNLNQRADTLMDLLDAICSTGNARSVVEYSLSDCYRRSYSTIFKGLDEMDLDEMWLPHRLGPYLARPQELPFWLLIVDVSPGPREYAHTLEDRGFIYSPGVVRSKTPVRIGHQYSTVVLGLEGEGGISSSWVLPLMTKRVGTNEDKEMVGSAQIEQLLKDEMLPFGREFTVEVGDTGYSKPEYLHSHRVYPNLVTIARVRSNRTFYHEYVLPEGEEESQGAGHPTWYGERFSLPDSESWTEPDAIYTLWETNHRGQRVRVEIQSWENMLMKGKRKPVVLPMHKYPFTLVRIVRYDEEGNELFKHPLWVIVVGERRGELTLEQIYQAYKTRFDVEHFFRFGKQKMLLVNFQTAEVRREENWWQLIHIAYAQLWMARHLAQALPRPWERNLLAMRQAIISPTLVQRDFGRIIQQLGTPAQPPKPRGISPGRPEGTKFPKRERKKVVVKAKKTAKAA